MQKEGTIKSFLGDHKEQIFHCILALLIFLYGTYRLPEVGQPILFNDEFGYWSASSFFLGIDWSPLTSHIAYYSYGYGILLAVVRCIGFIFAWSWKQLYEAAVVLNALMLVISYVLALRISERYFDRLHWIVRGVVCFAAVIYPSNIVYAHITWTENTLTFLVWVFLYLLMRCIAKPSVKNHLGLAFTIFYMYTVHQRALSVVITGILIIIFMRLLKINKWKHTAAFFGGIYSWVLVHSMIKGKLQNDFYLGNPAADFGTTIGYAFNIKSMIFLVAIATLLFILYLLDKGKVKWVLLLLGITVSAGILYLIFGNAGEAYAESGGEVRLSTNDFSGQWYKIKGLFTIKGILRLGISIVGKWFYLAAGTGLIICFGMKDLIKQGFWMTIYSIQTVWRVITGKEPQVETEKTAYIHDSKNIWLFAVLLTWLSTFMVCAIYKEGFYKVDDLVNGRYNEYVIGILLIISMESLIKDKKWLRTTCICVVLYLLAGTLCQNVFDEIGRTDFEMSHSVMFGRVFWNWQVPTGKVKELSGYILPLGLAFILVVKLEDKKFPKASVVRALVGLLIPIVAWTYLSDSIIKNYVVVRNEKQAVGMPPISFWIKILGQKENVYYLADTQDYRWAEGIQFMLQDMKVTLTTTEEAPWDEDAFFIMHKNYTESDVVKEKGIVVIESGVMSLVINNEQELASRFATFDQ